MRYFAPIPIDSYITKLITEDRLINELVETWNIEREEIIRMMITHYKDLGYFVARPLSHEVILRKDLLYQLRHNKALVARMRAIQRQIESVKSRHARDALDA